MDSAHNNAAIIASAQIIIHSQGCVSCDEKPRPAHLGPPSKFQSDDLFFFFFCSF